MNRQSVILTDLYMKLVIVESPTKTKSLTQYLGSGYKVLATMGHLRDLPKSKMGVEVKENNNQFQFEPSYIAVKGKGKQIKQLKDAAKTADLVYLATDPDREGEAIAWHTLESIRDKKDKDSKFQRVAFHSITKEAVLDAIKNPRELDLSLVNAQQARRLLDRLVGYNLSPVLWRKVRRGLSGGRVQSVAVRLIVDREREIEAFKPEEYWQIQVEVSKTDGEKFWLDFVKVDNKTIKISTGDQAKTIQDGLKKADYSVTDIVRKERRAWAKPPFKTSTLQQAAANVLGWSSKKTMSVAQHLYEGGFITYHRTDSLNLVDSAISDIRGFVTSKYGAEYLPEKSIFYKTGGKVVAQEAHEAIHPTHINEGPAKLDEADDKKLYDLIWRRTLACQMKEAIYDTTTVLVLAKSDKNYGLQAKGEIEKFAGWRVLYPKNSKEAEVEGAVLPEVKVNDALKYQNLKAEQKFTQPPARYNDASLVKELEKKGIGRPSTYAPTISTILARNYVERKERRFYPTSIGIAVTDFLVKNFPSEMDYEFTAKMEEGLDDIARGKTEWEKYLSSFYGPFKSDVDKASEQAERIEMPVEKTGEKCPECKEGEVVIREGKYGKFLSCSRFPECKYTGKYNEYLEGAKCEKCGGRVVIKKTRFGKPFYGCENYPKCDWAVWKKPLIAGQEESEEVVEE